MNTLKKKFIIDILMFLDFLIVSVSGLVLWKILPRGSGKTGQEFILLRENWLFIHDWSSVFLVLIVIIHLVINWKWVVCAGKTWFRD